MASERALADKIRDDRGAAFTSIARAEEYLFDNLRVDEALFRKLDSPLFFQLAEAARSRKLRLCSSLLNNMQDTHE